MISEESFRLMSYVIKVGYWSGSFPYKWNPVSYKVVIISRLWKWHIVATLGLVASWIKVWGFLAALFQPNVDLHDILYCALPVVGSLLITSMQLHILRNTAEIAAQISACHLVARAQALRLNLDLRQPDGMEVFTRPLLFTIPVLVALTSIGDTKMIIEGAKLFRTFRTEYLILNLLMGAVYAWQTFLSFLCFALFMLQTINYTHGMRGFLRRFQFDPTQSELVHRRTRVLFTIHHVLHTHAAQGISPLVAQCLTLSCVTQISCFVSVLKLLDELSTFITIFLGVLPLLILISTKINLDFAMSYTVASQRYEQSFRAWCSAPGLKQASDIELYRAESRFFRAMKAFHFKIGPLFEIRRTTFAQVTQDVVLQGVLSILLI